MIHERPSATRPLFKRDKRMGTINPADFTPCSPSMFQIGTLAGINGAHKVAKHPGSDVCFVLADTAADEYETIFSIDVSNPHLPVILHSLPGVNIQNPTSCVVVGSYIYVFASSAAPGLQIIDPTEKELIPLHLYPTEDGGIDAVLDGSYLYVTFWSFNGGVDIYDVSDPLNPVRVGRVVDNALFNNARGITKLGNFCYVAAAGSDKLVVVDVTDPTNPSVVTSIGTGGSHFESCVGIASSGSHVYLAGGGGLTVVNVSSPSSPVEVGFAAGGSFGGWLVKDGNIVYISTNGGLRAFDVTTPTAPASIGNLVTVGFGRIIKNGNYIYATLDDEVQIIDVSTPSSPTPAATFTDTVALNGAIGIALDGSTLYVSGSETISELNMLSATSLSMSYTWWSLLPALDEMTLLGDYLIVTGDRSVAASALMTAIDVSDPTHMEAVAFITSTDLANIADSTNDGRYVYSASSSEDRVTITDALNPLALSVTGTVTNSGLLNGASAIALQGTYAYVAAASANLLVIVDVSNPALPTIVGNAPVSVAICVAVNGDYAYVGALNANQVFVVDVSDPTAPFVVGNVADAVLLNRPITMTYDNGFVYVGCQTVDRVTIVDVSDPTAPFVATSMQSSTFLDQPTSILKDGGRLFVAAGTFGVQGRLTILGVSCV